MESIFASMLLQVTARLGGEFGNKVHIAFAGGRGRPQMGVPEITIEFDEFRFESLAGGVQMGAGTLVVRLLFAAFSSPAAATPEPYRRKALAYCEIESKLHGILQGFQPHASAGGLDRISARGKYQPDGRVEREIRYSVTFTDSTATEGKTWKRVKAAMR